MKTPNCCDVMVSQLGHECSDHSTLTDCPDVVVVRGVGGQVRMPIRDGGSSFFIANFCPWCGTRLTTPASADHRWWSSDSDVLARIGSSLDEKDPSLTVLIPTHLADAAVQAWERDDIIGLAITERGTPNVGGVSVEVSAWQIGTALDAADRRNLLH